VSKPKPEGESRNKPNKTEFTVDIFTSKTSQEREVEEKKTGGEVSEDSGEEVELTSLSSPVISSRPTVKCLTCGKEFGKSSIKFHEPQCRKKKIAEDLRKEKEKSVVEEKPVSYIDHIPEEENLQDSFNAIWEAHMQQLIPCGLCARTFFPDRIEVHQRSCKGIIRAPKTADSNVGRAEFIKITEDISSLKKGKNPFVPDTKLSRDIPAPPPPPIQYFISK